jgi:hypothetical protein
LLLELVLMIGSVSSDPVGALKPKAHVEILGNVILGPVHDVVRIARINSDVLERFPAHESVVTDKRGAFAVADLESNLRITHLGKIGSTVLEEIPGNLVDAGMVLHDGDFWREEHFGRTIDQAVPGLEGNTSAQLLASSVSHETYNSSIGITHQDDFAYANVSSSFDTTILSQFFGQSLVIEDILFSRVDEDGASILDLTVCLYESLESSLDLVGKIHAEVRIRGFLESSGTQVSVLAVHRSGYPAVVKVSGRVAR